MTNAHENSPNGCWARNGCTVERLPYKEGGKLLRRIVRDSSGSVISDGCSYDEEMSICKSLGFLLNLEARQ